MKRAELGVSLFLMAATLFLFIVALQYPFMSKSGIGSGFFPRWASGIIFFCSFINFVWALRKSDKPDKPFFDEHGEACRVVIYIAALLVYVLMVNVLGMMLSTTIFMLCIYRFFDKNSWKGTLYPTAGSVFFIYLIFEKLLNLRMPGGFWK